MTDQHNSVTKQISKNLLKVSEFLTHCIEAKFKECDFTDIKKLNTTTTIIPINKNDTLEEKLKDKCVKTIIPNESPIDLVKKTEIIELNDYSWSNGYQINLLTINNKESENHIMSIAQNLMDNITHLCESHVLGNSKYYSSINISYDNNSSIIHVRTNFKSEKMIKKKNFY